jgi:hypothetical protein
MAEVASSRSLRSPPTLPDPGSSRGLGPIRQIVRAEEDAHRRYLVIAPGTVRELGAPVQIQTNGAPART